MSTSETGPPRRYLGIDLGGTASRFVTTDDQGIVLRSRISSTPSGSTANEVEAFFVEAIGEVRGDGLLAAIGVGASGPISPTGVIANPDTLPAFTGVNVPAMLSSAFLVPCFIDNDAVTAAIGEATFGAGRGFANILMLTLGTGIGVSMLEHGDPVRGSDGQHPESGHMSVGGPAAPCYCGRDTCWEQTASRTALQKLSGSLVDTPTNSSVDIDVMAVRADAGDPDAIRMFNEFGTRLAAGAATLLAIYRPEILLLGGSGATYLPQFGQSLEATLESFTGTFPFPAIASAEFGEYGGAIGAAALARARAPQL
jgi:glucokinase